jgi:hypothetical protein
LTTRLTLHLSAPLSSRRSVEALSKRLPDLEGPPIRIRFLPELSAGSRKLYSKSAHGQPVYAGTFIRKRRIVLDLELAGKPKELTRILTHELFHFAWARMGNQMRLSYEDLLHREWKQRARGELGWSAELRKSAFSHHPRPATTRRKWREYACESFCDTAAWLYSGIAKHQEFTLAQRHRRRREQWFHTTFKGRRIPI